INILLHMTASLAAFWVGWGLFRRPGVALSGALLFAVHPMHTESVAWIAGITDLGCGLFYFLSIGAYLRFREGGNRRIVWQIASLLAFLLSLLYKEMALTLPIVIVALDLACKNDRVDSASCLRLGRWFPIALVLLVYLALPLHV